MIKLLFKIIFCLTLLSYAACFFQAGTNFSRNKCQYWGANCYSYQRQYRYFKGSNSCYLKWACNTEGYANQNTCNSYC